MSNPNVKECCGARWDGDRLDVCPRCGDSLTESRMNSLTTIRWCALQLPDSIHKKTIIEEVTGLLGFSEPAKGISPKRIAIVIGHNARRRGARTLGGVSEYDFNSGVASYLQPELEADGFIVRTFERSARKSTRDELRDCYEKVNAWNPDYCFELHFNSGGGTGTEVLFDIKDGLGVERQALALSSQVSRDLGLRDRGPKPILKRGKYSADYCDCPLFILEPFFGDSSQDLDALIDAGRESGLADVYASVITDIFSAG